MAAGCASIRIWAVSISKTTPKIPVCPQCCRCGTACGGRLEQRGCAGRLRRPQRPAARVFSKQRAGSFVATNSPASWPAGSAIAVGDLNNDLRADLVVAGEHDLKIISGGLDEQSTIPLNGFKPKRILLTDYDNDGWLDVIAYGDGVRVWRNLGKAGFADVTAALGLDKIGPVDALAAADFDNDGDTDLILSTTNGLQFLRNDGGNANKQLKLRLAGILDEFCAPCGDHRKAALRLLNRPLPTTPPKRSGPQSRYDPVAVLPVLKRVWLASDQLCGKLLKAALPEWLEHHERRAAPLPEAFKKKLLGEALI